MFLIVILFYMKFALFDFFFLFLIDLYNHEQFVTNSE